MQNRMGPYLVLFLLVACAEKRQFQPGITTKSALVELIGEPLQEKEIPSGEVLVYPDKEEYQVNNGVVTTLFRSPRGDEENLLFWRHRFRNDETTDKPLSKEAIPEMELASPSAGISVVYLKDTGRVLRIYEYARR